MATSLTTSATRTTAAAATPDITFNGCNLMQDVNTGKYASNYPDSLWLYFVSGTSKAIQYCAGSIYANGSFTGRIEIQDSTNGGRCLGINTSNGDIGEESVSACGSPPAYDQWFPIYIGKDSSGTNEWAFENYYAVNGSPQCIYDYKQEPAIFTACNFSNTYEQFKWNAISP